MGLLQKAVETYDNMARLIGVAVVDRPTLLPISHITQKAQIEISIDRDGNFIKAVAVPVNDAKTVVPATEKSGSRTSTTVAPHPLSDQLNYLSDNDPKKFAAYLGGLEEWASSSFTHPKVNAICRYIESGTILSDLCRVGLVTLNDEGKLGSGKISNTDYEKCLVRWRVLGAGEKNAAWEDLTLFQAFSNYYAAKLASEEKSLCMVSGTYDYVGANHPKGITSANYGAKLISANDKTGFTFRGRFSEAWQAATVGYTASQKAHNALQWEVASYGVDYGGRTFICWNPKGMRVQQVTTVLNVTREKPLTPTEYKAELFRTISGLRDDLPDGEEVIIAAFDAATTGRLSLTYYNELRASDFHERIQSWYRSCAWENGKFGVQSPHLKHIAERAFGTEQSTGKIELDDRVLREQIQRLMSCITDCAPLPCDLVKALARRASTPLAYSAKNRAEILFTACALIRKYWNDKLNKEEWTMDFEPFKNDRDYQYGCLLAVMEKLERDTYTKDETREPNAIKLQSAFCQKPLHTAKVLNEKLLPYLARLSPQKRAFFKKRIGEIMETIANCESSRLNAPLGDTYLLGYYLQRQALYRPNISKEEETEEK